MPDVDQDMVVVIVLEEEELYQFFPQTFKLRLIQFPIGCGNVVMETSCFPIQTFTVTNNYCNPRSCDIAFSMCCGKPPYV